jgi:hypothetical protein
MKIKPGDIYVIRGYSILSKIIRLIISIRYGIPYRNTYSHIELAYDNDYNISAEPGGIKLVKRSMSKRYTVIYRLAKDMDLLKYGDICNKYLGVGYAYARYIIDTIRIASLILLIPAIPIAIAGIFFRGARTMAIIAGIIILIMTIAKWLLIKRDKLTHDCVELTSMILNDMGLWHSSTKPRNEFPNGMKQVLDNLVLYGQCEIITSIK